MVTADELPVTLRGEEGASPRPAQGRLEPLQMAVERAEVEAIRAALQSTKGRRAEAAELLGISRKTLWEKIKNLDISVDF
jgi:DNA-binding NtrC family response regulator